jgi:hypothetical protein
MFSLKKVALLAATGAFLVAPAAASASSSGPMTTGSGSSPGSTYQANGAVVPFSFDISAHDSGAPSGQFTFTRPDGTFTASVSSYSEVGNQAAFSGQITSGTGIFASDAGQYAYMGVEDNGQGASAQPDDIQVDIGPQYQNYSPVYTQAPSNWGWPTAYPYQVTSGNITVH